MAYVRAPEGFEVDFHARSPAGDEALIQVCATLDEPDTLAREVRALQHTAQAWPSATLQLIALDRGRLACNYRPACNCTWRPTGYWFNND